MMEIVLFESFTDYDGITGGNSPLGSSLQVASANNFTIVTSATEGGKSLSNNAGPSIFSGQINCIFPAPATKMTIAFGITLGGFSLTRNHRLFYAFNSAAADQWQLEVNGLGRMILKGQGGAILATSEKNFLSGVTYRCCMQFEHVGNNNCNVAISINGENDEGLEKVGIDLQQTAEVATAGFKFITYNTNEPAPSWELHDLIVGLGECVDWGPLEVVEGAPNVDIVQGWTRSTGANNFANVDEAPANGDTDYNYTETLTAKDIFGFTDPEVPEKIIALGTVFWDRKEDSATRIYRGVLRVGGVDYPGEDIYCSESWLRHFNAFLTNPATDDPWDPTDLAPLEFGYEYVGNTPSP